MYSVVSNFGSLTGYFICFNKTTLLVRYETRVSSLLLSYFLFNSAHILLDGIPVQPLFLHSITIDRVPLPFPPVVASLPPRRCQRNLHCNLLCNRTPVRLTLPYTEQSVLVWLTLNIDYKHACTYSIQRLDLLPQQGSSSTPAWCNHLVSRLICVCPLTDALAITRYPHKCSLGFNNYQSIPKANFPIILS